MAKSNGPVNYMESSNDARMSKGDVGLGLPTNNDYRGAGTGMAGGPLYNDTRAEGLESGDVMLVTKSRNPS